MTRLIQLQQDGIRKVGVVEEPNLRLLAPFASVYELARQPDTVRGPDVAFLSATRERELALVRERPFIAGAPDLAIEVLSTHDRAGEVFGKVSDYLAAGCRVVWVVDPVREEVTVFRSPFSPRVLSREELLDGEELLPGFSVRVAEIFEA